MTVNLTRRELIAGGLGAIGCAAAGTTAVAGNGAVPFGAAVRPGALLRDRAYRLALLKYCQQIVPESELKWAFVRPTPERFDFRAADGIVHFATRNGLAPRGHTLVWYAAMPDWAKNMTSPREAERQMRLHIDTTVARYRGKIRSWDVVNEAMAKRATRYSDLRPSVWSEVLGQDYIEMALRATAAVDPDCELVVNENDLAPTGRAYEVRRRAFLDRLKRLRDRDVPLHAVGIQGHIRGDWPVDRDGIQRLVAGIRDLGLDVLVTELDVIDHRLPADEGVRDRIVAEKADALLGSIFEVVRPKAIVTWGISDRYTWVPIWFSRGDKLKNRPLPLDANMRPKPLMDVIQRYRQRTA